jgi:hypothetical protein
MPDGPISPDFNIGNAARLPANEISMQAARNFPQPESKAHIPDIRMQSDPNLKKGNDVLPPRSGGLTPDQMDNELLSSPERPGGNNENPLYIENELLELIAKIEEAEGSGSEIEKFGGQKYSLEHQLTGRMLDLGVSADVLTRIAKKNTKEPILQSNAVNQKGETIKKDWYPGVPSRFGFESETIIVDGQIGGKKYIEYVYLGTEDERNTEHDQIDKFMTESDARTMYASLFGYYKRNIENISGMTALYLLSQEVKPKHVRAEFSLPCLPEDEKNEDGTDKMLKSIGGVIFPNGAEKNVALGRMSFVAQQIYEANGLCEKPELYKDYISQPAFKKVVSEGLDKATKAAVMKEWFGNPDSPDNPKAKWKPNADQFNWEKMTPAQKAEYRTKKSIEDEQASRGKFTFIDFIKKDSLPPSGNIWKEASPEYERELVKRVATFLGGTRTAELAAETGYRNYRLQFMASMVGYEYYPTFVKDAVGNLTNVPTGKLEIMIPIGTDTTDDTQKALRIAEYEKYYSDLSRWAFPRGEHDKLLPLATDIMRGIPVIDISDLDTGKTVKRKTLYDYIFKDETWPDEIPFDKLPERALCSGYLRLFMATGGDYGKGSLDILAAPVTSAEEYLNPSYWGTLQSKLNVGVKKDTVANFVNEMKRIVKPENVNNLDLPEEIKTVIRSNYEMDSPEFDNAFKQYKLEIIRIRLDGIFAEAESVKWGDTKKEAYGAPGAMTTLSKRPQGISGEEKEGKYNTLRVIEVANEALPGLKYDLKRLQKVREAFHLV